MTQEDYKGLVEKDDKVVNKYFRLYFEYIRKKCYFYTNNNYEDSEELAIDAFMRFLCGVKNFKSVDKGEKVFKCWLNKIIYCVCCTNLHKKNVKTYSIDDEDRVFTEPSDNDIHTCIEDIIYNLNDNVNKSSFVDYYINGKSLKEISLENNKKIDTIKVQCMRFRNNLKKEVYARVY